MVIDDLIYGKLLDSLYPKSFLMTDEDGLQHEVIHYGDVKDAIEDLRIELKQRLEATCSKTEKVGDTISRQAAIDIVTFECGKWKGPAKEITKQISALPSVQPKRGKTENVTSVAVLLLFGLWQTLIIAVIFAPIAVQI